MRSNALFRDINVHASASHYAFTSPSSPAAETLVVDRPSGDLRLNKGSLLGSKRVSSIAGILGIISLRLDKYIIVITKAQALGRIKGHTIYKVVATEFLPLREHALHDPDEDTYLRLLQTCIKTGPMYFSYSLDLTNSFQRQSCAEPTSPMWRRADDRFFWNRFIQSDLIDLAHGRGNSLGFRNAQEPGVDPFILPVIFGIVRIAPTTIFGSSFTFALITRRSRHRAGTRYMRRGIDENGHVANYNETEQIIVTNESGVGMREGKVRHDSQVLSYVQTRGSVPVYWSEINSLHYVPSLQVRTAEASLDAAQKHFREQIDLYGDNYLVNLVNQKGREDQVKTAYEQLARSLVTSPDEAAQSDGTSNERFHTLEASKRQQIFDRLHYIYFDFHNETKGLRFHRAKILLEQLESSLLKGHYFRAIDMPADSEGRLDVRNRQTAVVRTNCMDCLDRTNVVQSMLGRYMLTQQLIDLGFLRPGQAVENDGGFENLFRNVWADNADVVSKAYSGTGALKTDLTRTGKRTIPGAVQDLRCALTRYIKNNFMDGPRQDAFDVFLGVYQPSPAGTRLIFVDQRPSPIQAIPYIFAGCVMLIGCIALTRTRSSTTIWPLRFVTLFSMILGVWCARFILQHGMLYVNWPKLLTPRFAIDGVQRELSKCLNEPVVGSLLARYDQGLSTSWQGSLEDGKIRIQ